VILTRLRTPEPTPTAEHWILSVFPDEDILSQKSRLKPRKIVAFVSIPDRWLTEGSRGAHAEQLRPALVHVFAALNAAAGAPGMTSNLAS
jgi:hypothetical protein